MIEAKEWRHERERMVKGQIIARGVKDERVLDAMRCVPRHLFVDKIYEHQAYNDYPLSVGHGQTISQPYMVAVMTELLELKSGDTVLEIGTGSGYQTAILALLCKMVYSIERLSALKERAREQLDKLGFSNVAYMTGDGSLGWPQYSPFDGIIVTAGAPEVPNALIEQLAEKGRLVIPVGTEFFQTLNLVTKQKGRIFRKELFECTFVPLVGKQGWKE
ncbi:MAG: protein-L-isoaspartate(D-aspartate) O-methyltransferase [candidate division WOR-3 bacterium]|nr:MAG: protein-L-isoaspartate(D-aspartate) O-methyltransferase [candidate division WOR-3 bacterium]